MARTTKPCPGCGKVNPHRKADEVCWTCQENLKKVAAVEAELAQLRARMNGTLAIQTEPHPIWVPDRCYFVEAHRALYQSEAYRQFADATVSMIQALVAPLDRARKPRENPGYNAIPAKGDHYNVQRREIRGYAEISKDGKAAAQAWWRVIGEWSKTCYAIGVKDGQDLLGQLAAGELTVGQVNDRVFEITTGRRAR